jgi:hypothetical protein
LDFSGLQLKAIFSANPITIDANNNDDINYSKFYISTKEGPCASFFFPLYYDSLLFECIPSLFSPTTIVPAVPAPASSSCPVILLHGPRSAIPVIVSDSISDSVISDFFFAHHFSLLIIALETCVGRIGLRPMKLGQRRNSRLTGMAYPRKR